MQSQKELTLRPQLFSAAMEVTFEGRILKSICVLRSPLLAASSISLSIQWKFLEVLSVMCSWICFYVLFSWLPCNQLQLHITKNIHQYIYMASFSHCSTFYYDWDWFMSTIGWYKGIFEIILWKDRISSFSSMNVQFSKDGMKYEYYVCEQNHGPMCVHYITFLLWNVSLIFNKNSYGIIIAS